MNKPHDVSKEAWAAVIALSNPKERNSAMQKIQHFAAQVADHAIRTAKAEERGRAADRYREGSGPETWDYFVEAENAIRNLD